MIAAIETAIVSRLTQASAGGTLGYRLRSVATYGGEFDDDVRTVVRQFPAAWVAFAGYPEPEETGPLQYRIEPTFTVIVAARNARNEQARRHGSPAGDVGSYQLLEDVRGLLVGQTLGLDIEALTPGAVRSLFTRKLSGQNLSAFTLDLRTAYVSEASADAGALDDFSTFGVDWDLGPAPDGQIDAQDELQNLEV